MHKSETSYFDPQTGKIIHRDLTQGRKAMNETVANGETAAKKTKGNKIKVLFLTEKGETAVAPQEGCRAILANFIKAGGDDQLDLRLMVNEDGSPADILFRLAAFGAATLGRNEVNTTPEEDGEEEAAQKCKARFEGFRHGSYRSMSIGGATPLILLALERAKREAGESEEKVAVSVAKWRAAYDAGDEGDDKARAKARAAVVKELKKYPPIVNAMAAIQAERDAIRLASQPVKDLGDI